MTNQPRSELYLENTFMPLEGENIIKTYECREGCSSCCGPRTTIALTNIRVISRQKQPNCCYCCSKGAHIDKAIFLRDIEVIGEFQEEKCALGPAMFIACATCTWPCLLCAAFCCPARAKVLQLKGGFGSELLALTKPDIKTAANDISTMVLPFKGRM